MHRVTFHTFTMGDVDDPEIYAAQPIYEWQQTEQGRWVMDHCNDPKFAIEPDGQSWGHRVRLYGDINDKDATFFKLKWGHVAKLV
jgi:hypothetical protein